MFTNSYALIQQIVDILEQQFYDNFIYRVWATGADVFAFNLDIQGTVNVSRIFKDISNKNISCISIDTGVSVS